MTKTPDQTPFRLLRKDRELGENLCYWGFDGKTVASWLCCLHEKESVLRVRAVIRSLREQGYKVIQIERKGPWAILHYEVIETSDIANIELSQ